MENAKSILCQERRRKWISIAYSKFCDHDCDITMS
jgi:hypothetical protein